MKTKSHFRKTASDRIFDAVIVIFVFFVITITLYPLIYVFSMSISDPIRSARPSVHPMSCVWSPCKVRFRELKSKTEYRRTGQKSRADAVQGSQKCHEWSPAIW